MVFKVVNDTMRPDDLVPAFFVFGAYVYIVIDLAPSPPQQ